MVESAVEGTRKPEEEIYYKLLEKLKVSPGEVIFLDDLGSNLKAAKTLGFQTIKVMRSQDEVFSKLTIIIIVIVQSL